MNRFEDTHFSSEDRYALGIDPKSGRHYLAIPVSNGALDYDEHFALTPSTYERFVHDSSAAARFAQECRRREHDNMLLQQPGTNRGTPV